MRKAIGVSALILALTCSVYAGDMPNGSPAPPNALQEQTADGDMPNGLTETVLSLLASVLTLF